MNIYHSLPLNIYHPIIAALWHVTITSTSARYYHPYNMPDVLWCETPSSSFPAALYLTLLLRGKLLPLVNDYILLPEWLSGLTFTYGVVEDQSRGFEYSRIHFFAKKCAWQTPSLPRRKRQKNPGRKKKSPMVLMGNRSAWLLITYRPGVSAGEC